MAKIRRFARELAEGAALELWDPLIEIQPSPTQRNKWIPLSKNLLEYLGYRWENDYPDWSLLQQNGYLDDGYKITKAAFQLLEEAEAAPIFISYKRSTSSALALLILLQLKTNGLEPFLDMSLEPGEDWHAGLKERIQQRDNFILLLGKDTLSSKIVQKEIEWAFERHSTIIPVWHNGFEYSMNEWGLNDKIHALLSNTHSIKVLEESASGYYKALVELLNHFGITPG